MTKLLYPTREAKIVLGGGHTTLYGLINKGLLEARKLGHRTYITAASLEAFIAALPPVVTPTMERSEHKKWSRHRRPGPKPQEDDQGIA
jgi:hypothetical protein